MKRILVGIDTPAGNDIDFSAYKTSDKKQVVFVIANYESATFDFKLTLPDSGGYLYKCFQTSANPGDNLRLAQSGEMDDTITIPGNSVATVVLDRK
jgi:hypothetical protein